MQVPPKPWCFFCKNYHTAAEACRYFNRPTPVNVPTVVVFLILLLLAKTPHASAEAQHSVSAEARICATPGESSRHLNATVRSFEMDLDKASGNNPDVRVYAQFTHSDGFVDDYKLIANGKFTSRLRSFPASAKIPLDVSVVNLQVRVEAEWGDHHPSGQYYTEELRGFENCQDEPSGDPGTGEPKPMYRVWDPIIMGG